MTNLFRAVTKRIAFRTLLSAKPFLLLFLSQSIQLLAISRLHEYYGSVRFLAMYFETLNECGATNISVKYLIKR